MTSSQVRLGEGKRRRGWQRVRRLDSINDSMDVNLSKLQELVVKDRGDWHAAVRGISKSWKQFSESTTTRLGKIPM